jgi:hypothetical protein
MAGEGRPSMSSLVATTKFVDGRARGGDSTWVNLSAGRYYTLSGRGTWLSDGNKAGMKIVLYQLAQ